MSGHSKWATIKRKKAANDAARGKLFAKLIRAIEVAAREGDPDPESNATLADAIQKAKDNSVPKDTIERAVKRGAGDLEGVKYEPAQYEGYAVGGVAVLVDCLTDNRNRTASDVRQAFTKIGGNLADPGSVAYLFTRRGQVVVASDGASEDDIMVAGLDDGLEDVEDQGEQLVAWCDPSDVPAAAQGARVQRPHHPRGRLDDGARDDHPGLRRRRREEGPPPPRHARRQRQRPGRVRELRHRRPGDGRGRSRLTCLLGAWVRRCYREHTFDVACRSYLVPDRPVRVLGVDPGLTRCGVGIVEGPPARPRLVAQQLVTTPTGDPLEQRLLALHDALAAVIAAHAPDEVGCEQVLFSKNVRTAMATGQAAGVVLLTAAEHGLPVSTYTPTDVKLSVAGHGAADKDAVARMVAAQLGLQTPPRPADVADAVAIALCHLARSRLAAATTSAAHSRLSEAARAAGSTSRQGWEAVLASRHVRVAGGTAPPRRGGRS